MRLIISSTPTKYLSFAALARDHETGLSHIVDLIFANPTRDPSFLLLSLIAQHGINHVEFQNPDAPTGNFFATVRDAQHVNQTRRAILYTAFLAAKLLGARETPSGELTFDKSVPGICPIASLARHPTSDFEFYYRNIYTSAP